MMDIIGDRNLRGLLAEKVALCPNKKFLVFEDKNEQQFTLTYKQFKQRVDRLSNVFINLEIKKGDNVTLHLPNSLDFFVSWFALVNIGAIMVPTNILSTETEMEYILSHSNSVLLITEETYLEKFKVLRSNLPSLNNILLARCSRNKYADKNMDLLIERAEETIPAIPLQSEDVAAMLYTSGTTSKPKGVHITHANYIFVGEVMSKSIRLTPEDRQFIVLPLFHGNAQYYSTMSALSVGASVAITEKFSASRYLKQAKRLKATVGSLFAAPIRMILNQKYDSADKNNNLRLIWFAQALTENQIAQFQENFDTKLLHLYGMTETIATPLMNPLDGIQKNMGIGKPTIGYEVKVINEFGEEVSRGDVGQLIVKGTPGRTLMKGYFNNEKATNETLQNGWLYTEDNVRVDNDGYFFFVDREKDMIKKAGENIATNEIETVLAEHPSVYESAVIGVPDEIRDETIKAFIILHSGLEVSDEEIKIFCSTKLAKFKIPEYIEFVTEFPRTSVGKIQKHLLHK